MISKSTEGHLRRLEVKQHQAHCGTAINIRNGCCFDRPLRAHHVRREKYWRNQWAKLDDRISAILCVQRWKGGSDGR